MSLPKQVQLQAEEAERLEKQYLGLEEQPPEAATGAPAEQVEEPATEAPAEVPEPKPEAPKPTTDPEETWEARYRSLQGRWNAEVPRLQSEVKQLSSQLSALSSKLEAQEAAKASAPEKLVTDSDVEAFGSDLIDVMERKAREVVAQEFRGKMSELEARNAELEQMLSGVSERQVSNDRRAFFAELERLVPDYEALNVDPGFMGWLAEVDPLSGYARQDYLNTAYNGFDVGRTAALFNAYKQLVSPAPAQQPARKLERQVAPGTSKVSTVASQNASERVFSQSEIEGFYRDVQRGAYRGNEAEQARIEAEIDLAVIEGRIR